MDSTILYTKNLTGQTSLTTLFALQPSSLARFPPQIEKKEAIISYVIDSTGIGGPITDIIEQKLQLASIKRVYITRGSNVTEGSDYNEYHVPKGQPISGLLAAFDSKTIYMSRHSKEISKSVSVK